MGDCLTNLTKRGRGEPSSWMQFAIPSYDIPEDDSTTLDGLFFGVPGGATVFIGDDAGGGIDLDEPIIRDGGPGDRVIVIEPGPH